MAQHHDFHGKSGTSYRYMQHEEGVLPWPGGGNVLFVRKDEGGLTVVHAAESENLSQSLRDEWGETYGGADLVIFVRLNVLRAARAAELADILALNSSPD